jgi:hypothetical protein
MADALIYQGDRILIAQSFLYLIQEKPNYYDIYEVIADGVVDTPQGKILSCHVHPKEVLETVPLKP